MDAKCRKRESLMNCSSFETLLTDYMDGTLEGPVQAAAQEHVGRCRQCSLLTREVAQLRGELEAFPWVRPPADLVRNILLKTTGLPQKRTLWRDFIVPTVRPFMTQRFAFATLVLFVFLSLMVNIAGPPVGAVLSPSKLAENADRVTGQINKKWAQFSDFRSRAINELRLLAEDLYGRIDYHLIQFLFESYSEPEGEASETPTKDTRGSPPQQPEQR